ncbi:hypothetical protein [Acinetobacter johnsonii]|uniref:hypothetical protein n=1 Tax=Acinetobacter johnsonii TaxID=40214 RepID=UPI003AF9EEBF
MATLATNVSFQCFDLDGKPLAGGKVYTYSAGTTTSKATYTTMAGTVANPNPVILDQNGKAKIFLGDGSYRLQIKDSNDALIDDIDQISRYVTQSEFATFQQTVNDGVTQLTEVREQIDVFVNTSIGNQKGFANGIAPLDPNVKIDPIYLPVLPNDAIPQATETAFGVAKIATTAIAQAGTNDTDIITAKKLRNALNAGGSAPVSAVRAYCAFNGDSAPVIYNESNVLSITVAGSTAALLKFTVTFKTPMPTKNYAISGFCSDVSDSNRIAGITMNPADIINKTVSGFDFWCRYASGGSLNIAPALITFTIVC